MGKFETTQVSDRSFVWNPHPLSVPLQRAEEGETPAHEQLRKTFISYLFSFMDSLSRLRERERTVTYDPDFTYTRGKWNEGLDRRSKSIRFVFTLLVSFLSLGLRAAVRLETTLEPREAAVGDLIRLNIQAGPSANTAPQPDCGLKDLGKSVGPFEVVEISSSTLGKIEVVFRLFDVGVSTLPALSVTCRQNDKTSVLSTPEIPVTIKSVLTKDSKDIHGWKGRLGKVLNRPVFFGLLGALALGVLIALWVRRRKGGKAALPPGPPPVLPHVRALEALRRLEEEFSLPAKVFYSRLTDIFREYLEGAFHVPALDRTTTELVNELKNLAATHISDRIIVGNPHPLPVPLPLAGQGEISAPQQLQNLTLTVDQRLGLRAVLENADLAKFAKLEATVEEKMKDFERVQHFVLETQPAPEKPIP